MLQIGVVGYTGWMGKWHLFSIRKICVQSRIKAGLHLFAPHPQPVSFKANVCADENAFYQNKFDLLVLATHPHQRLFAYQNLANSKTFAKLLFIEKPLSTAQNGEMNTKILNYEKKFKKITIVHYPEIFDPLTERLLQILDGKHARVPRLKINEIQCFRSKDRENGHVEENKRHTEPLVVQEGVHDLSFILFLLKNNFHLKHYPKFSLEYAHGSALYHPGGKKMKNGGSSYAFFKELKHGILITIVNSFKDPYKRKEKIILCKDAKNNNYTIVVNYYTEERRSLRVYNYSGEIVYDASDTKEGSAVLKVSRTDRNTLVIKKLFNMMKTDKIESNFDLALLAEDYANLALSRQIKKL